MIEIARVFYWKFKGGWHCSWLELSRLRRNFFDKIDRINKIFLYSLYPLDKRHDVSRSALSSQPKGSPTRLVAWACRRP